MCEQHVEAIRRFPLFEGYTGDGARRLLRAGEVREHAPGAVLLREGEPPSSVLLLLAGRVEAFVEREGRHVALGEAGEGTILGELAVLGNTPRAASVLTLEACSVLHWPAASFRLLLGDDRTLAKDVLVNIVRMLIAKERSLIDSITRL